MAALRFYWVVAASGGVLMALEILSSRVLAPYFGNSVYVWGSIISVFLAALAVGYFWGGRLADREPTLPALGRLLVLAALCQGALLLGGTRVGAWFADLTARSPGGTLLAAAALFGLPSVLLATVSPYAVRLAARDLAYLGNTAGRLYALSTLGSLAGTLAATFLLIPYLELRQILGLLVLATVANAALALAGAFRSELAATALAGVLGLLALAAMVSRERLPPGIVYQRITPYQTLEVIEGAAGERYLKSDGIPQSAVVLATGETALSYPRYATAALLFQPEMADLLVLGMGAGSVGRHLEPQLPHLRVANVDLDPAVPEIARRFFGYQDQPRTTVHIADARSFLARDRGRWDYIYCDVYIGLAVPFHLTTVEFLREVKAHLAPGGVFALNLAGSLDWPFPRAIYRTLRQEFPTTHVFQVRGASNLLLLATAEPSLVPDETLLERARRLDRRWTFDPPLAVIARSRVAVDLDLSAVPLLTDAYAPVEHMVHLKAPLPEPGGPG